MFVHGLIPPSALKTPLTYLTQQHFIHMRKRLSNMAKSYSSSKTKTTLNTHSSAIREGVVIYHHFIHRASTLFGLARTPPTQQVGFLYTLHTKACTPRSILKPQLLQLVSYFTVFEQSSRYSASLYCSAHSSDTFHHK